MHKVRVGVLRGGASVYETSLKTGDMVVRHLPDNYFTEDIFISKDGVWHKDGLEVTPHQALSHIEVVFNALHGPYAESTHLQHLLELHRIPFTGSGTFAASASRNSLILKELLRREGIKAVPYRLIEIPEEGPGEELEVLFRTFAPPIIVRSVAPDEGMIARTYPEFVDMLEDAFKNSDQVILEEYISGTPASVGIIEGYRDEVYYALPPVSAAPLSFEDKKELEEIARRVHQAIGMRHYSRTDFIVSANRGIFVTQTVPLPSLHDESVFHKALTAVGAPVSHFLDHILQLALHKKKATTREE